MGYEGFQLYEYLKPREQSCCPWALRRLWPASQRQALEKPPGQDSVLTGKGGKHLCHRISRKRGQKGGKGGKNSLGKEFSP